MLAMYIVSMPNKYVPIKFLYISVNQSPFSMLNSLVGFLITILFNKYYKNYKIFYSQCIQPISSNF